MNNIEKSRDELLKEIEALKAAYQINTEECKLAEDALIESENKFNLLNDSISEMLALNDIASIFDYISTTLLKHLPDTIILFNSIDEKNKITKLEKICGLENSLIQKIISISGFDPVGKIFNLVPTHHLFFSSGNFVEFPGGLVEFSGGEFPAIPAKAIEKLIGLHKIYTIGINKDDTLLAALHFFTFNNREIKDSSFIESLVKQAGIIIQKNMAEKDLRYSEEKLRVIFETLSESVALNEIVYNDAGEMVDYRILDVNDAFYKYADYSKDMKVVGNTATNLYGMSIETINGFWKSHKNLSETQYTEFKSPIGDRWFYISTSPIKDNRFVTTFHDITKRKLAEDEISKSVETLKMALDVSNAGTWDWDIENNTFNWSDEFLKIFHLPSDTKPGFEAWTQVLHPDDIEIAGERIQEAIDSRTELLNDYRIITNNNEIRWIRSTGKTFYRDEKPIRMIGLCLDVTDQKRSEEAMRESEERFRNIFNNAPIGIYRTTREGEILLANPKLIEMLGFSSFEDLKERNIKEEGYLDSKIRDHFVDEIESKGVINNYEVIWKKKDGSNIFINEYSHVVCDGDGNILYYEGTVEDVTERKNSEDALKESEKNLAEAQSIAHIGSWEWDMVSNKVQWSQQMFKVFDISPETFDGKPETLLNFVHPDDLELVMNSINANLEDGRSPSLEYRVIHKDGSVHNIIAEGKFEFDYNGKPIRNIGTAQDITERKKAEEILSQNRAELKAIYDYSPVMMCVVDSNRNVIFANPAFSSLTGATEEQLVGGKACGVFGCINALDDINGCGFGKNCQSCNLKSAMEDTLKNGTSHINIEYETTLLMNGETRQVSLLGSTSFILRNNQPHLLLYLLDITDRKQTEEVLKKSEQRNADMLANIGDVIVIIDKDGNNRYKSPNIEKLFGWKPEDVIGNSTWDNVHSDDLESAQNFIGSLVVEPNKTGTTECRYLCKDGTYKWIEFTGVNLLQDPEICGILGNYHDITERKEAEETLKNLASTFSAVSGEEFFYRVSCSLTQTFAVDYAFIGQLSNDGKSVQVITGQGKGLKLDPFSYDLAGTPCDNVLNNQLCYYRSGTQQLFPNDTLLVQMGIDGYAGCPIFDKSGEALGIIVLLHSKPIEVINKIDTIFNIYVDRVSAEIERIKALRSLKESEERFKIFTIMASEGIMIHENGTILDANQAFLDLIGCSSLEDIIGKNGIELIPFTSDSRKKLIESISLNSSIPFDVMLEKADGTVLYAETQGKEISFNGKNTRQVYMRDITERKRAEEKLQKQNKQIEAQYEEYMQLNEVLRTTNIELIEAKEKAEESDKLKTAFLQNMSHEIRTPLNGIIGFSRLLEDEDITKEEIKEYTGVIQNSGIRLIEIVNNVLDISKIETGQVKINNKSFSVNSIITNLNSFFSPIASAKELKLNAHTFLDDANCIVNLDDAKLHQILTNLINNSIKFTNTGSIDFGYEIVGNEIQFYVKDTGSGISAEDQEKIFERFTQANSAITRGYEGAGLGLAICRGLVELMGGRLWVESEAGKGSTFFFNLPYCPSSLAENFKQKRADIEQHQKRVKILIAEDDRTSFEFLKKILKSDKYMILRAENGQQAVDIVKATPDIDLILMDIKMPVLNGMEATKQIKQIKPDLPIIAQTAYAFNEEMEEILSIGCDDYIIKPIEKDKLLLLLGKYV
jgi:PAS domain S-box-containing protein